MTVDFWILLRVLLLLAVANTTPLFATLFFGKRFDAALDHGRYFLDGRPLLGPKKTIRGIVLSLVATSASAPLFGVPWQVGLTIAAWAMIGDLLSSFTKRRLGTPPSAMALGLDQVPESLLPLLAVKSTLTLDYPDIVIVVVAFFVLELLLSRVFYWLHLRDRPY